MFVKVFALKKVIDIENAITPKPEFLNNLIIVIFILCSLKNLDSCV